MSKQQNAEEAFIKVGWKKNEVLVPTDSVPLKVHHWVTKNFSQARDLAKSQQPPQPGMHGQQPPQPCTGVQPPQQSAPHQLLRSFPQQPACPQQCMGVWWTKCQ